MKNKDFDSIDKIAQDAFNDFEATFDPMDWMDMQSKLSAESSIDKAAKQALKNYKVPFDEQDWKALEKQLDKREHLFPYVWWVKGAEAGVMALLLFTIFNLSSDKNYFSESNQTYASTTTLNYSSTDYNTKENTSNKENTFVINQKENTTVVDSENSSLVNNSNQNLDENSNTNTTESSSNTQHSNTQSNTVASKKIDNIADNIKATTNTKNTSYNPTLIAANNNTSTEVPNQTNNLGFSGEDGTAKNILNNSSDEGNNLNDILAEGSSNTDNNTIEPDASSFNNNNQEKISTQNYYSVVAIETIDVKEGIKNTDPVFQLKKAKLDLPYVCRTFIGGRATMSANFANNLGGTSIGYGVGFSMDSELSPRIALKTGIGFSYKKFDLSEKVVLDNSTVDGNIYNIDRSKTTNLIIIEIPLDVQYTFFKNEKWKIYLTAGVAANLISSRTYTGTEKTSFNGLSISTDINSNSYERGLFEGGQFSQNAFLSVGAGLGLERQLGENISLYLLPVYRHSVTPIGDDFMSSFNINVGVKTALK